jgi:hypothetical protein
VPEARLFYLHAVQQLTQVRLVLRLKQAAECSNLLQAAVLLLTQQPIWIGLM